MQYHVGKVRRCACEAASDEADRIGLAERKRRVAAEHEMFRVDGISIDDKAGVAGLEADGVEIQWAQVIAKWAFQTRREPRIGIDLPLHARAQHRDITAEVSTAEPKRRIFVEYSAEY